MMRQIALGDPFPWEVSRTLMEKVSQGLSDDNGGGGRTWLEAVITAKSLRTGAFSVELITASILSTRVCRKETIETIDISV
jgi:hypothetical protein